MATFADVVADYEIVEPADWPFAGPCPVRLHDDVLLRDGLRESWGESAYRFARALTADALEMRTFNDLRSLAVRCEAFAQRVRESADIMQSLEREGMGREHLDRARSRRMSGLELVRCADAA